MFTFLAVVLMTGLSPVCSGQDVVRSLYPPSTYITGVDFHYNTIKTAARGSDIWPVTWAADDQLYTAWGDGNGFSGAEKVSWGIAQLRGVPGKWSGKDVFYGPRGAGKGKISGLLAIGNILYGWKNNQNRPYPYCDISLIRSTDHGLSWSDKGVRFGSAGFRPVSFINYGPGYAGSRDAYVYIAGFKAGDPSHNIYLVRVYKDQLERLSAYEYLSGTDGKDHPVWSRDSSLMSPIFRGVSGGKYFPFPVIVYNAGLRRYLLTDCHGPAGEIGIFEGAEPWGPWKTVYYDDHWGGLTNGEYLGFEFPNKWASPDGRQLQMVFSVYDSNRPAWNDACNSISVTLMLSKDKAVSLRDKKQKTTWHHLSTVAGQLPAPGKSHQQTAAVVHDFDKDGVNGFILGFREQPPALVWYRRQGQGWKRYVIDTAFLTIEAGGAVYDIDHDGDPDLVLGGDWQSNKVWWWENPYPRYKAGIPWERHIIKNGGRTQHHDQVWGDFMQTGTPQLAFWNQGGKTLFLATIPAEPEKGPWALKPVFNGSAGESNSWYAEGAAADDIDGDGHTDLLAGNYWFKYEGNGRFKAVRFAKAGGRIATGRFKPGRSMQVVISPGDGTGYLKWYECTGNPEDPEAWKGHNLVDTPLVHCHSLAVADINGDGHTDIFAAEMAKWSEKKTRPDNPKATAFIFYGDGKGHFTKTVFAVGIGFHEARVADLDGDGDMDILDKPYNWEAPRLDIWLQNDVPE